VLECDFTDLAAGESKIIRFDVTGSSQTQQFHIESNVSLETNSELQDPDIDDNIEDVNVWVSSPTS